MYTWNIIFIYRIEYRQLTIAGWFCSFRERGLRSYRQLSCRTTEAGDIKKDMGWVTHQHLRNTISWISRTWDEPKPFNIIENVFVLNITGTGFLPTVSVGDSLTKVPNLHWELLPRQVWFCQRVRLDAKNLWRPAVRCGVHPIHSPWWNGLPKFVL